MLAHGFSVQFSRSVMSDSLQPCELQHAGSWLYLQEKVQALADFIKKKKKALFKITISFIKQTWGQHFLLSVWLLCDNFLYEKHSWKPRSWPLLMVKDPGVLTYVAECWVWSLWLIRATSIYPHSGYQPWYWVSMLQTFSIQKKKRKMTQIHI